jgi:hypothetical protein
MTDRTQCVLDRASKLRAFELQIGDWLVRKKQYAGARDGAETASFQLLQNGAPALLGVLVNAPRRVKNPHVSLSTPDVCRCAAIELRRRFCSDLVITLLL